jgi:Nif-specific regulatory protein
VILTPEAVALLEAHPWPGNIRELGNLIERLVLLADHTHITAHELERFMPSAALPLASEAPVAPVVARARAEAEAGIPTGAGLWLRQRP